MATTMTRLIMFVKREMRQTGLISLRAPKKQSRVASRHAANPIHDPVARRAATTWRTDPAGENGSGAGTTLVFGIGVLIGSS